MGAFVRWLALTALGLGLATAAIAGPAIERPPKDPQQVRWDPAIRTGVLPNGLRYAVMRNATPAGGVSIRLGIAVGSADERDDELGAAHFLEHMAFGGSHAQLAADVEKTFADAGVAFGRDRNAQTSPFETTYEIDLPHGDAAALDLGFRWLRQVADGAQLTPDTIDRERGVILAERETRLSAESQISDRVWAMQAPGTRMAKGPAIGTVASIDALTAPTLQAFYDRWYQPQNAAVVAIGDEPLDDLEKRVRDTFGGWRGRGPAAVRALTPPDPKRGLEAMGVDGANTLGALSVCRIGPPMTDPPASFGRWRRQADAKVAGLILNTRLAEAARSPAAGLMTASDVAADLHGFGWGDCVVAATLAGGWTKGLATVQAELAGMGAAPPSEDELERAIKTVRGQLRGAMFAAATRASDDLADQALSALIDGEPFASPAEAMRAFDLAVEDMAPADAEAVFRRDWAGLGPLIAVISPSPPAAQEITAAWLAGAGGAAPKPDGAPSETWNYASFGKPGKVVKRETVADGGYLRVTFANGVVLNVKHSDYAKNSMTVAVRFGGGRRALADRDYVTALLGGSILGRGGLARDSYNEVNVHASVDGVGMGPLQVKTDAFTLSATASSSGTETALQLLAAYLSEPGFRDLDPLIPPLFNGILGMMRARPSVVAMQAMTDAVAPGNPQSLAQMEQASALTGADMARVLKPIMTGSPLEVTIVGDIDEADAVIEAGATFGALPPRRAAPVSRPDAWFLRFPEHPPALIHAVHQGPPEKAAVAAVWPLYIAEPARRREEYALSLAARVYQEALLRRIRGDLGKAYSPSASTEMPDHGDQGYMVARAEVGAADVEQTRTEMIAIAGKIARGEFTDQDVETVRKPLLATMAQRLDSNEVLAGAMHTDVGDEHSMQDLRDMPAAYASITPAEVRKAAADWMSRPPIVVVVTGKPPPPAASSGTPAQGAQALEAKP